ncbi:MAG: alpha/beta fold hydrolase [Thermoanaerobaculales bacterium]|jgi:pimeloyl-ACP methyl ester carboxylesterase|nr:alpha/beta fold hydrolase [Thermoanaerobaculales bacterium]
MTAINTIRVAANGLDFEVAVCGNGPRFALLLHGFPECNHSWRHQLPLLAELGYTAWAPNLRGYGGTTRPSRVGEYRMRHLVDDVAGLIDAAGAERTLLVGHDWGGAIAWIFALAGIRPLDRFIVMNLPHPKLFRSGLKTMAQLRRSWYIFFFQLPWLPERFLGAGGARRVSGIIRGTAVNKERFQAADLEVYRRNAAQTGAIRAMLAYYRAFIRYPMDRDLARAVHRTLETPTLMLWGEEDTALGKELTVGTDELVRDFTLRYLPGVSHWVQQEAPETVNAMIRGWIEGRTVLNPAS